MALSNINVTVQLTCGWCGSNDIFVCGCFMARIATAQAGILGISQVFPRQSFPPDSDFCVKCNHNERLHWGGGCSGVHAIWQPMAVAPSPGLHGPITGEIVQCDCRGFMAKIPQSVIALQEATRSEFFRNLLIAAILESEDEMLTVRDDRLAEARFHKITVSVGEDGKSAVIVAEPK